MSIAAPSSKTRTAPPGRLVESAPIVSGAPPAPTVAVRLPQSASGVVAQLRNSSAIASLQISAEWNAPAYAHRDQLLLDESGPHPRLWIRPPVDEHAGVVEARVAVRTYADVAVLQLEDKYSGGCELVVTWELHPKTRRFKRYRYVQVFCLALSSAGLIGLGTATFLGIVLLVLPIYLLDTGLKAERDAFDAVAAVQAVLAESEPL